jgi:signal transduction histidine kinase
MDLPPGTTAMDGTGSALAARLPALVDRAAPWLLAPIVFALSLSAYRNSWQVELVTCALAASVAAWAARGTVLPLFAVAAVGWIALGMWPAVVVASYYAATTARRRHAVLGYTVVATTLVIVTCVAGPALDTERWIAGSVVEGVIVLCSLVFVPLLVGLWVAARRQVVAGLHERALQAEREQRIRADRARGEERARIAREMHDVVAHRVTRMVLQAGALEVGAKEERTAEAAAAIRLTGREALADLRQVLGVLRAQGGVEEVLAPQPVLADLDRLLDAARETGVEVVRRDEGAPRRLADPVERAACRVVQEALLNVRKHAPGSAAEVVLRFDRDLEVEVTSAPATPTTPANGVPAREALPHSGFGLVGLAERVELLGGSLDAGPRTGGGFRVLAKLPAAAPAPGGVA